jgi:hypothetical protein
LSAVPGLSRDTLVLREVVHRDLASVLSFDVLIDLTQEKNAAREEFAHGSLAFVEQ